MDQQWPLPQKQTGTASPDGGGRAPRIARNLETGQLQVITPHGLVTEDTLTQRLFTQLAQPALLQSSFGKQSPAQHSRPPIAVQYHLAAQALGLLGGHQLLLIGAKGDAAIAEQLQREVTVVTTQASGHGVGLQQPGPQSLWRLTLCGSPPRDELDEGNSQLGLHSFTIRRFPLSG